MSLQTEVILSEILAVLRKIEYTLSVSDKFTRVRVGDFARNMGVTRAKMDAILGAVNITPVKSGTTKYISHEEAMQVKGYMETPGMQERINAQFRAAKIRSRNNPSRLKRPKPQGE